MSTATERSDLDTATIRISGGRSRRRRTIIAALGAVVLLVAAAVLTKTLWSTGSDDGASGTSNTGLSTAVVQQQTLRAQTSVSGTLGYSGDYTVLGSARGTITALPAVGQLVRQGQTLYEVDGAPVILLYGSTPAYRRLAEGSEVDGVSGQDVKQLNAALVALGYASSADLDPSSDEFGWATKAAIKKLQDHLGVTQTGALEAGQYVFLPTEARITSLGATLGGQVQGPVLKATSTQRQVVVKLDAAQQSQVKVGDQVTITLPNNQTTPGRVSAVSKVATASSGGAAGSGSDSPTIEVDITPARAAATGTLDQAPVQVAITTDTARDSLVVPVGALLALAGGGYAVEVVADDGTHRLLPVTLGLFDDGAGQVQVTGSGLSAGQHVVVPST